MRSTELRVEHLDFDELATQFIQGDSSLHTLRFIAHRPNFATESEYAQKEIEVRMDNHIPAQDSIIFLEIRVADASDFAGRVYVEGVQVGSHRILRAQAAAVPNAIAATLLHIRDQTGKLPHAYFGWAEGNPIQYLMRFILFGEGDIAVVTREVLRQAETDPEWRPAIHVGG